MSAQSLEDIAAAIESQWPASSVERAQDILRMLLQRRHGTEARQDRPTKIRAFTWRSVMRLVTTFYDVTEEELMGQRRVKRMAHARFALYVALTEFLGMSANEIACIVKRDHTSVLYGLDHLDRETDQWQRLHAEIAGIRFDLTQEEAA